jgi:hypothetical protein
MDNVIHRSKELAEAVASSLKVDKLLDASNVFKQLQELSAMVKTLAHEVELIKQASQNHFISYLKQLRYDIQILESPKTLVDLEEYNSTEEVAKGIRVPYQTVSDLDCIPDTPLYHVKGTDEFAVKINGQIIKGRIHSPDEQGFKSGNWIYTREPLAAKNKWMRHIGDPKILKEEIEGATREEKRLRLDQLAHDLLICLCFRS